MPTTTSISPAGETFSGRFIKVPDNIAEGTTGVPPQTALENWSNENNIFQFIRVEDIAYDQDNPRVVYFADTGTTVAPNPDTGRMRAATYRASTVPRTGRAARPHLQDGSERGDPKLVDSLTIFADGNRLTSSNFTRPDNIEVGNNSIMVQEDNPNSRLWRYSFGASTWTAVAIVDACREHGHH